MRGNWRRCRATLEPRTSIVSKCKLAFKIWRTYPAPSSAGATFFEKLVGPFSAELAQSGKTDPDAYEKFTIRKIDFGPASAAPRNSSSLTDQNQIVWLCFPGFDSAECKPSFYLSFKTKLIPQEGVAFVFHGPASIAGYTPEQCIDATERVGAAVDAIIELYPQAKYKVFCLSAGTHLGFFIASRLGRRFGAPIEKLIALAPGESIAYGIFSTWVTDVLAKDLKERGITEKIYDERIARYTQKENIEFLPCGEKLMILAGARDTFIPIKMVCGTDALVSRLRAAGKNPSYEIYRFLCHVTLPLMLILLGILRLDPYGLRKEQRRLHGR